MKRAFDILISFMQGLFEVSATRKTCRHQEKEMRSHLTEKQIDKMVADSFPTSDPPSTY